MDQPGLTQLASALLTQGTTRNPERTRNCLSLGRIRSALVRENWTAAEDQHGSACACCAQAVLQASRTLWHPRLVQLLSQVHAPRPAENDLDLNYHLEKDGCCRCRRVLAALASESLLAELAPPHLRPVLEAAAVASLPPPWSRERALAGSSHPSERLIPFDEERLTLLFAPADPLRLRLEWRGALVPRATTLAFLVLSGVDGVAQWFVLCRPADGGVARAEIPLTRPLPGSGEVLLLPGEPLLRAPGAVGCLQTSILLARHLENDSRTAWSEWGERMLTRPLLLPAVQQLLEKTSRGR